MKKLSDIQTLAREYGRNDALVISSGTGLEITNQINRKLAVLHPWPELYTNDTTLTVTKGTETYNWPDTVRFIWEPVVEIQDSTDGKYRIVIPSRSEIHWSMAGRRPNGSPEIYRRSTANDVFKISFRPIPDNNATVRLCGYEEPKDLVGANSATIYQNPIVDDAFALWVAAIDADHSGFTARAAQLIGNAAVLLTDATGKPITPADMGVVFGG